MLRSLQRGLKGTSPFFINPNRSIFGLKGIYENLKGLYKNATEPGPGNHNPNSMEATETELFDEDAHEVQAMVTNNPFDLDIMMGDNNPQRNFGTVDNPVLMFSANVGWRYVMCSGMNEEDEGLSHTGVWFILREGPIHRCPCCGQCFKLINLRDEISPENDYFLEHYMPILEEEMGDDDDLVTRWTFHKFAEPYPALQPMANTHHAYILVNQDDHDRILTDPAYRLQKLYEGHVKLHELHQALIDIEERILWQNGGSYPKVNYTIADYEDLITSELAIRKLDRIFEKVQQFQKREILDPENHERREKRMRERAEERMENTYTHYINTNEMEQQYKDYYETDQDPEEEILEEQEDYEELVASGIFNFKNYNFVEEDSSNPVGAIMGTFERKVFKFKHRKWNEDPATHFIRENRMIRRYLERMQNRDPSLEIDPQEISEMAEKPAEDMYDVAKNYRQYMMDEAILQYKDYYESDEEDIKDFDYISPEEKLEFAQVFKDYSRPLNTRKTVISIPKREWDSTKSISENFSEQLSDIRNRILPSVKSQIYQEASKHQGPYLKGKDVKLSTGTHELKNISRLDEIFGPQLEQLDELNRSPKRLNQ